MFLQFHDVTQPSAGLSQRIRAVLPEELAYLQPSTAVLLQVKCVLAYQNVYNKRRKGIYHLYPNSHQLQTDESTESEDKPSDPLSSNLPKVKQDDALLSSNVSVQKAEASALLTALHPNVKLEQISLLSMNWSKHLVQV